MSRTVTHLSWFRVALGKPGEPPKLVAASGEHLGVAVAAAEQSSPGWFAIAATMTDATPLGDAVGKQPVVALADPVDAPIFHWPIGVLPSPAGTAKLADVRRGWIERPTEGTFVLEAQPDAETMTDTFLGLIEKLPSADNLEVRLLEHFDDAGTAEVWITSRINAHKIISLIDDHEELLVNGHLELSVYVRAHRATLRLTEHKTIVWLADDRALAADVERWFGELGLPHLDTLTTVAAVPHTHYRPAKSRERKRLAEELFRQRLRRAVIRDGATGAREPD